LCARWDTASPTGCLSPTLPRKRKSPMDEPKTSLLSAAKPAGRLPLAITLAGEPGTGKTTLASMFPSPFMIQTLGESVPRDVPEDKRPAQLGVTEKPEQLWDQLKALINEQHDFKTLITDSV